MFQIITSAFLKNETQPVNVTDMIRLVSCYTSRLLIRACNKNLRYKKGNVTQYERCRK
jgi:hypothetical protein